MAAFWVRLQPVNDNVVVGVYDASLQGNSSDPTLVVSKKPCLRLELAAGKVRIENGGQYIGTDE
jgi:hypothetical protein